MRRTITVAGNQPYAEPEKIPLAPLSFPSQLPFPSQMLKAGSAGKVLNFMQVGDDFGQGHQALIE
jgi:hypothetical protein